jgi:predicted RNase H-like nuclease
MGADGPLTRSPRGRAAAVPDTARSGRVAGVDGCPGGWLVVRTGATAAPSRVEVVASIVDLIDEARRGLLDAVAIDMPMGLPSTTPRASDAALRARLGPRRASLFPTPPRVVLEAIDYADACARARACWGKALSRQAWNLVPKIRALDAAIDPSLQDVVAEAHPETSFAVLAGAPLRHPKSTAAGRQERRDALAPWFADIDAHLDRPPRGASPVDVLDGFAAAWTARRIAAGTADWEGGDERDERGLAMRVAI